LLGCAAVVGGPANLPNDAMQAVLLKPIRERASRVAPESATQVGEVPGAIAVKVLMCLKA